LCKVDLKPPPPTPPSPKRLAPREIGLEKKRSSGKIVPGVRDPDQGL
jgi:hypothetical protein